MSAPSSKPRICLMGVSYSTGNLGVSALAEGAIQGILAAAPGARITIVSGSRESGDALVEHGGSEVRVKVLPIRYGKRLLQREHILRLHGTLWASRLAPSDAMKDRLVRGNPVLEELADADVVGDLSGGDSFTDMYGGRRMALQTLLKTLVLGLGRDLVLLPQTIGPFHHAASRAAARFILRRVRSIYTRDLEGMDEARNVAQCRLDGRLFFAPDVGMLVEPAMPRDEALIAQLEAMGKSSIVVGVNASGLLYSGGYTRKDQFGVGQDYGALMLEIVKGLLSAPDTTVVFVPHVAGRGDFTLEDDASACGKIRAQLDGALQARTFVAKGDLSVREAKYVIGRCVFLVGSRMHACINALSQGIPAVGIAYSRKFRGVFESLDVGHLVVDVRTAGAAEAVGRVLVEFGRREKTRATLARSVPEARRKVHEIFRSMACGRANG